LNNRIKMKTLRKTIENGEAVALRQDLAEIGKSIPALRHAVEEVAEDNMALMQAVKRTTEGQEALRAFILQELGDLRSDISRELVAHSLRNCCREFSPVLNALESMMAEADFSDHQTTRQHIASMVATMGAAFSRMGIERIPITVGSDLFDSRIHECARVCTPTDSPFPEVAARTIVRVQEPGYTIQGRFTVPAKVWVQKVEKQEIHPEKDGNV